MLCLLFMLLLIRLSMFRNCCMVLNVVCVVVVLGWFEILLRVWLSCVLFMLSSVLKLVGGVVLFLIVWLMFFVMLVWLLFVLVGSLILLGLSMR